jgi:hypothetical protein
VVVTSRVEAFIARAAAEREGEHAAEAHDALIGAVERRQEIERELATVENSARTRRSRRVGGTASFATRELLARRDRALAEEERARAAYQRALDRSE